MELVSKSTLVEVTCIEELIKHICRDG